MLDGTMERNISRGGNRRLSGSGHEKIEMDRKGCYKVGIGLDNARAATLLGMQGAYEYGRATSIQ